jgi:hypothetical protein
MKASGFYLMIPLCQTTWRYIPQDHHLHAPFFPTPIPVAPTRPCEGTTDVSSVFITWNGISTVLPVKISTLFSALTTVVVKMMGIKTTQIYPEEDRKYFPPKDKKKPRTLRNVKSTG